MGNLKTNMAEKNVTIDLRLKKRNKKLFFRRNEAKRFNE